MRATNEVNALRMELIWYTVRQKEKSDIHELS